MTDTKALRRPSSEKMLGSALAKARVVISQATSGANYILETESGGLVAIYTLHWTTGSFVSVCGNVRKNEQNFYIGSSVADHVFVPNFSFFI